MRSLVAAAVMASRTMAFMIPAGLDLDGQIGQERALADERAQALALGVNPASQILELPCPGCPFAHFHNGRFTWDKEEANSLIVNISTSEDRSRIEFNGAQIFPPPIGQLGQPEVLQIPAGLSLADEQTYQRLATPMRALRLTSWSLHAGGSRDSTGTKDELIKAHIQVEALEHYPINVREITVTAVNSHTEGLMIIKAEITHRTSASARLECDNWPMLCQWRQVLHNRIKSMQSRIRAGCRHMRMHTLLLPKLDLPSQPEAAHSHHDMHRAHHDTQSKFPQHQYKHHHHQQQHQHHTHPVMHEMSRLVLTIVIPILFGVLAGTLTYMLGMLIGTGMAVLWNSFRSRRQRRSRILLEDVVDIEEVWIQTKEGFEPAQIEVPPLYSEVARS